MTTTPSLRSAMLTVGAALLLFVLWKLANMLFTLAVPILLVWLILSWNHPQRASALFGSSTSRGMVRAGLGGGLILCAFLASATAPRAAPPASSTATAPERPPVTGGASSRNDRDRLARAEAQVKRAQPARAQAGRQQEELARQPRNSQSRGRHSGEEAPPAATATATPVDPNAPEKDLLGYCDLKMRVQLSDEGVTFFNDDVFDYTALSLRLNSGFLEYGYQTQRPQLSSNASLFVPYSEFAKNGGERFSLLTHKVNWVHVYCQTRYGRAMWAAQNPS